MRFTEYDTRLAAYALIFDDQGQVLLTWYNGRFRGDPCWTLPGGEVELGESIEDAVVREVFEEAGYDVRLTGLLTTHTFTSTERERPFRSVRIVFTAEVVGGELGVQEVDGTTDDARWLPLEVLPGQRRAAVVDAALEARRARAGRRVLVVGASGVISEITDLPDSVDELGEARGDNARVRREAVPALVAAARDVGARVLVQSVAWPMTGEGAAAVEVMERATLDADGVVLRYGQLYGPGTFHDVAPDGPAVSVTRAASTTAALLDAPRVVATITD